jgi:hypothetical protein
MWRKLRDEQHYPIISTWIDEAGEGETDDFGELWSRIKSEIASSAGLVLYAEQNDFPLKGALVEVGIAIGMHLPVVVVLDFEPEARTQRPIGSWIASNRVYRFKSVVEAFTFLGTTPTRPQPLTV